MMLRVKRTRHKPAVSALLPKKPPRARARGGGRGKGGSDKRKESLTLRENHVREARRGGQTCERTFYCRHYDPQHCRVRRGSHTCGSVSSRPHPTPQDSQRPASTHDVLDVNFPLLRVRLLCQPREPLLEVLATGLGITGLAIEVLQPDGKPHGQSVHVQRAATDQYAQGRSS